MVRTFILIITAFGTLFANSQSFVDTSNIPKWFIMFGGVLAYVMVTVINKFYCFDKSVRAYGLLLTYGVILSVSAQALYGILQYFKVFYSSTHFPVTGSFDNPAGFVASLIVSFPFFLLVLIKAQGFWRWGVVCLSALVVLAVFFSESRTGILSLVIILLYWGAYYVKFPFKFKLTLILMVLAGFMWSLYLIKKDSADGRLLIWKCSLEMIKDNWLIGYGSGGFEAHYMDYQADYFRQHPDSPYAQLADDVQQPFNEYLKVLINYGIMGFMFTFICMLMLFYVYYRKPSLDKRIAILSLLTVATLSLFSYPTHYPFVWMIAILDIFILLKEFVPLFFNYFTHMCLLMLCTMCSYLLYQQVKAELKWRKIAYQSSRHSLSAYEKLEKTLGGNRYFMYNYAVALYNCKQTELSLQKALLCRHLWVNYDLELLLGDIYQERKDYKQAEAYYRKACCMCPCRFYPLYQLYELYKETGNEMKAFLIAEIILEKPVKVNSILIKRIKSKINEEYKCFLIK